MSEKQPKLKFEEEKERTATRSPPKKSKVEQSKPKKQKLKLDADKAAEKAQHLRFGKAEINTVKCPQPPHPAERTLHVSFCPFFVAGTGRTVSLATPSFRFFTIYRKFGGLRWLLIRAMS